MRIEKKNIFLTNTKTSTQYQTTIGGGDSLIVTPIPKEITLKNMEIK